MARWGNIKLPATAFDSPLVSRDQVAALKADLDSTSESESKTLVWHLYPGRDQIHW